MKELTPLQRYECRLIRLLAQQLVQDFSAETKARLNDSNSLYLMDADDWLYSVTDDLLEADPSVLPSQIMDSLAWSAYQAFKQYDQWSVVKLNGRVRGPIWTEELHQQMARYLEFTHNSLLLSESTAVTC